MEKNKVWIIIIFSVALYLIMGIYADFGRLIISLEGFNWLFIPLMLIVVTISYFIRFLKWNFFLRHVGVHLKIKDNLFVFFSGLAMIITPAKAGEIWKGWLIKEINGESLNKTIPVVIVDRMTDVIGLVILSITGVIYYESSAYLIIIIMAIFISFVAIIRSERASERLIKLMEGQAKKYGGDVRHMHQTFQKTIETKYLVGMSFLSMLAWFLECLALFLIINGFQQSLNILLSTFIFSFASLAGAVSMIPGGLGVAEATISGLLVFFGLNPSAAVGVAIVVRFGTLWYGAVLGFLVYLIFKKRILNQNIKQ